MLALPLSAEEPRLKLGVKIEETICNRLQPMPHWLSRIRIFKLI